MATDALRGAVVVLHEQQLSMRAILELGQLVGRQPRIVLMHESRIGMTARAKLEDPGAILVATLIGPFFDELVPDVGGTTRLVRTIGRAKAKELILTGRMIPANEALQMGLLTEVAPDGTHVEAAVRLAEEIAENAPLAVGLAKRLVDLGSDTDAHTFQAMELLVQSVLLKTDDAAEGTRALAERRPPRFSGR